MNAYLFLFEKFKEISSKYIDSIEEGAIVLLTDKRLMKELENVLPRVSFIYINLFSDENSRNAAKVTEEIMCELSKLCSGLQYKDYDLSEILVNQPFGHIEIIYNLISSIDKIVEENGITKLFLYSGHPKVQFLPLTLSEGERSFRFLYKRPWFLNYFVDKAFSEKIIIEWSNRSSNISLRFLRIIRPMFILTGKVLKVFKRSNAQKNKERLKTCEKKKALFFVRNPIQVEPLIPLYNEFFNDKNFVPLVIMLENYSNNDLLKKVSDKKLNYFDLYSVINLKIIFYALFRTLKIVFLSNKKSIVDISMENRQLKLSLHEMIMNLSPFIFDVLLFEKTLSETFDNTHGICCLINNETHGYHSAFQGEWIRKKNGISYGVQHVTIANKFKPRISRVDKMFMMSQNITNQLSEIKPNENFLFFGPLSYDVYFNKSLHKDDFCVISIFTQPDDFKKDYLKIIEDVIDIIKRNNLDFKLNIKLHPRERDIEAFEKFAKQYCKAEVFTAEYSSNELVINSDLVISINSGVIMQSIIIGTPIISVNYEMKHQLDVDFIRHAVTKKAETKEDLESFLKNLNKIDHEYKKNRESFFEENLNNYSGGASKIVYNYIKNEIYNCIST